jgi:abortive infection bacteriophage resistance protein
MEYNKKALEYSELIAQMKCRGLMFHDETKALRELSDIGYFRLATYLKYFEIDGGHQYKSDSFFEDAITLYYFDKRLRALLFTAIQSVEVSFRAKVSHYLSLTYGAFWFADASLFRDNKLFLDNLDKVKREVYRSKEDFILDYFEKYTFPNIPPSWKTLEVASFGTVSRLFCNLNDNAIKKRIARLYNLPQHQVLESWIKGIILLRNCIAHHARIWNRRFPQMPKMTSLKLRDAWIENSQINPVKLYPLLCCLVYLQNVIHPDNDFKIQLKALLDEFPMIQIRHMGFPHNWEKQPLWNI